MSETIYVYEMSNVGASYEKPRMTEIEKFKADRGLKTYEDVIKHMNNWGGIYFIGTEAEYKALDELEPPRYWVSSIGRWTSFIPNNSHKYNYLKDGKYIGFQLPTDSTEKTEAEYNAWRTEYNLKISLENKVGEFKSISSPKLAAYILKCEEYVTIHNGAVKADALTTFIGANGKLDLAKLETQIKANKDKRDSILVLGEVYLTWIKAIEDGTQASLDTLPDLTPNELNRTIDTIWKAEHDKERTEAIKVFHSSEDVFKIVDKYNQVTLSDEPEQ